MKEDAKWRKGPSVGQYNPKLNTIRPRMDVLTYKWKSLGTEFSSPVPKKQSMKPICDRIIRTLNKKHKWTNPSTVKLKSPLSKEKSQRQGESFLKSEDDEVITEHLDISSISKK